MISAIVLAAGKSSRMGAANKMLLPFGESTILGSVVSNLEKSLVNEVVIVTDSEDAIGKQLTSYSNTKIVVNKDADMGMTTSIQCGVKATSSKSKGFMICLGDMPALDNDDFNLLINNYLDKTNEVILVPKRDNRRGNPVIFSHHFLDHIMKLESMNGCKPLLLSFPSYVVEVPVLNEHFFLDIDTKADYRKAQKDHPS